MSVARLLLAVAGAVAGFFIGGPFGAHLLGTTLGFSIGGVFGALLFPPKGPVGPRLNDLRVSSSTNGAPIAIPYGRQSIAGNLIWSPGLVSHETQTSTGGLSGGQTLTSFTYTASFAFGFCEGPACIRRVWGDSKLIWLSADALHDYPAWDSTVQYLTGDLVFRIDAGNPSGAVWVALRDNLNDDPAAYSGAWRQVYNGVGTGEYTPLTQYPGDEAQLPDPTIQAAEGAANTPAFRGLCYAVWVDFPLGDFGNRIPNMRAEIVTNLGSNGGGPVGPCHFDIPMPWEGNSNTSDGGTSDTRFWAADNFNGIFVRDPARPYIFAVSWYFDQSINPTCFGSSQTIISRINTSTHARELDFLFPGNWFNDGGGLVAQIVVDPAGFVYVLTQFDGNDSLDPCISPTGSRVLKYDKDFNLQATSSIFYGLNIGDMFNHPGLQLITKGGVQYIIIGGQSFGPDPTHSFNQGKLALFRCSDLALIQIETVGDNFNPDANLQWPPQPGSLAADSAGNLWLAWWDPTRWWKVTFDATGFTGSTLFTGFLPDSESYVGSGTTSPVWEQKLFLYDPTTNSIITQYQKTSQAGGDTIADSLWRKINLTSGTPTLETSINAGHEGYGFWDAKLQEGFGADGSGKYMFWELPPNNNPTGRIIQIDANLSVVDVTAQFCPNACDLTADWCFSWFYDSTDQSAWAVEPISVPEADFTRNRWEEFFPIVAGPGPGCAIVPIALSTIVNDICKRSGLAAGQIDASLLADNFDCLGYTIGRPTAAVQALLPLAQGFFFDGVESDGKIKFIPRGQDPVLTIPEADLGLVKDHGAIVEH